MARAWGAGSAIRYSNNSHPTTDNVQRAGAVHHDAVFTTIRYQTNVEGRLLSRHCIAQCLERVRLVLRLLGGMQIVSVRSIQPLAIQRRGVPNPLSHLAASSPRTPHPPVGRPLSLLRSTLHKKAGSGFAPSTCRSVGVRTSFELIPKEGSPLAFGSPKISRAGGGLHVPSAANWYWRDFSVGCRDRFPGSVRMCTPSRWV